MGGNNVSHNKHNCTAAAAHFTTKSETDLRQIDVKIRYWRARSIANLKKSLTDFPEQGGSDRIDTAGINVCKEWKTLFDSKQINLIIAILSQYYFVYLLNLHI